MLRDYVVKNGPFRGMKFPKGELLKSSAFSPKLIGSYESELHSVIVRMLKISYTKVVNIGSAEGYYAVGLALKIPSAKVYAYDIDLEATKLLEENAAANSVRVITNQKACIEEIFTPEKGLFM